jgi:hypothetical protein
MSGSDPQSAEGWVKSISFVLVEMR